MRFLVVTTLYPNAETPTHGVFVENRLRAFLKQHDADVRVIAPVPWFPLQNDTFGRYARWARVPEMEQRHGIKVYHPRYIIPPKLGMNAAPSALARCLRKTVAEIGADGWDFDFIDAHYFFPDGVAAATIAKEIGKPIAITARGTDVNLIPQYRRPRQLIEHAAFQADAIITVAEALKEELIRLGAPADNIRVLRNGVDLDAFCPVNREAVRQKFGLTGAVIASVGHLTERKGHDLVIGALPDLPGVTLMIAGEGEQQHALEAQAHQLGVSNRVRFLGALPHESLKDVYNAADALVLASSREGWPNVLLEAMACGAPSVATKVWGNAEVIREPAAGRLVGQRSSAALASAVSSLLASSPDRSATRAYAERFSWDDTVDGMAEIFSRLKKKSDAASSIVSTPAYSSSEPYTPRLLVTVDAEERFDWSDFSSNAYDCCDPKDIERFQTLCRESNIKPLYFLTYPVLTDWKSGLYYRNLERRGEADCGLHLHQWSTPPHNKCGGAYYSFQSNLAPEDHLKKLSTLAGTFETVFGKRATAHRAGRYGMVKSDYPLLAKAGILFDFSPSAGFDFSSQGGPDFSTISNMPHCLSGEGWNIHVTPVSGARALRRTRYFYSQETNPGRPGAIPMRLSPEGAELADLKALTKKLIADKTPVLTLTLHSTSLTPGANAYAADSGAVAKLLDTTRRYLEWFRSEAGGEFISLSGLTHHYEERARKACA